MNPTAPSVSTSERSDCIAFLLSTASTICRAGRDHHLKDLTVVMPLDYAAIRAVEMACRLFRDGSSPTIESDLRNLLEGTAGTDADAGRLMPAIRGVAERVMGGTRTGRTQKYSR